MLWVIWCNTFPYSNYAAIINFCWSICSKFAVVKNLRKCIFSIFMIISFSRQFFNTILRFFLFYFYIKVYFFRLVSCVDQKSRTRWEIIACYFTTPKKNTPRQSAQNYVRMVLNLCACMYSIQVRKINGWTLNI